MESRTIEAALMDDFLLPDAAIFVKTKRILRPEQDVFILGGLCRL